MFKLTQAKVKFLVLYKTRIEIVIDWFFPRRITIENVKNLFYLFVLSKNERVDRGKEDLLKLQSLTKNTWPSDLHMLYI